MGDYNIIVKNMLSGGSGAKTRLSGKKSSQRNKNTMRVSKNKNTSSNDNMVSLLSKAPTNGVMGKVLKTAGMLALGIETADKVARFGIHLQEAQTGNQLIADNTRNSIDIVKSGGMSLLKGAIQNELFTKKVISRQNFGLDYGREIYGINVEGSKYKRI